MLLRLRVTGFKNLIDLDVRFGSLTCIAGGNGVGKSNVFDALTFLSATAQGSLLEAVAKVRNDGTLATTAETVFFRIGTTQGKEMQFTADLLIPTSGIDDGGRQISASSTLVRYQLKLGLDKQRLVLLAEDLRPLPIDERAQALAFPHSRAWQESVVAIPALQDGSFPVLPSQLIDTDGDFTRLWMERTGQVFESYDLRKTPRTTLAGANATVSPIAWLVKRELASWRFLHLETSALRTPDLMTDVTDARIGSRGEHLPATLRRLSTPPLGADTATMERAEDVPLRVAGWLDRLIGGVRTVGIDEDSQRNTLALYAVDLHGTRVEARALSDGTLRFLALALLAGEQEPSVICIEEPENGVHPDRIPTLIDLLEATAVDPHFAVDATNPLKQVIIATHAPAVVQAVPDDSLLYAETITRRLLKKRGRSIALRWLRDTWRADSTGNDGAAVARGYLFPYANVFPPDTSEDQGGTRRVSAHPDLRALRFPAEKEHA